MEPGDVGDVGTGGASVDNAEDDAVDTKLANWAELEARIDQCVKLHPNIVTLNVGGTTFQTSKATLLRWEGTYFHALLGSGRWKPDGDAYFLDLDPTLFRRVLFFLRTERIMSMVGLTAVEWDEFLAMLEYLKMDLPAIRWDPETHGPDIALSKDLRTIQWCGKGRKWQGAVAEEPLVATFTIRVDSALGSYAIGIGPFGMIPFSSESMSTCYLYVSHGAMWLKEIQIHRLPPIEEGDVVTIRRTTLHVMFAVNDGEPFKMNLVGPSEELYPVVFMVTQAQFTILD
ncbi:hypothetical protein DYB37_013847 [Aphanomyces astaci]|uniref:BTB domain-containing protein n=1 Tax=Aphanomyces astaci TaxID=112090 RepID=A0A418EQU7_APHAT|nr:hypothetical protein DYB37_013847 [Aphanomyces astaci]